MTIKPVSAFVLGVSLVLIGCGPSAKEMALKKEAEALREKLRAIETAPVEISGEVFVVKPGQGNVRLGRVSISAFDQAQLLKVLAEPRTTSNAALAELKPKLAAAAEAASQARSGYEAAEAEKDKALLVMERARQIAASFPDSLDTERKAIDEADRRLAEYNAGAEKLAQALKTILILKSQIHDVDSFEYYQKAFKNLPPPLAATKSDSSGKYRLLVPHGSTPAIVAFVESSGGYDAEETETYHWVVSVPISKQGATELTLSNDNLTSSGSPDSLLYIDP